MKTKDYQEEVVKTEFSEEKNENILLRKNSETNLRIVTLADFHKQDFSKFLVLPKRRADSNSVYSFGLKYAINKEKHIVKELKNDNYFKFDYNILRNRIKNDINLREKLLKRIILNKNLKKKFALLEKPFPLLNKISNCKSVNKSEDFLMSIIMNHKFDIGEELLMELIEIRKNKQFDIIDKNKQKSHLLRFTNNKITENKEEDHKNRQIADVNRIDFKNSIINKRKRTVNPEKNNEEFEEDNYNKNLINFNKENLDNSRNRLTLNFSESKESKENGSYENNKNDFFLISSNFDKIKTNRRFNKRKKPKEEINLSQKHEQELIKSLDFDFEKQKYEMSDCNNRDFEQLKKQQEILIFNGNSGTNFFSNLKNNNNVINKNNNIQSSNHDNKINKVLFTNSKIARNTSLKNLNQGQAYTNIPLEKNLGNHMNFNNNMNNLSNNFQNNYNSNEESLSKTKISIRNVSTFNSKFNIQNFLKKDEKDDSKSGFYESLLDKTENIMNFQKYGNKTVSTENDFRKFNKNALNKILDSKRNSTRIPKQFNKPNFIKYKFPEENNKPVDMEFEKIKSFVNRKNKSSQIKSRILGVQQDFNNSIFDRFKKPTEVSNFLENRNNNFLFDSNLANLVNIRLLSHNNISEGEIGNNNNSSFNKKLISNTNNSFKKSIYLSNKSQKKITSNNIFNIQQKQEMQVSANPNNENENDEADASFNGLSNNNTNSNILKINSIKKKDNFLLLDSQKKSEILKIQTARNKFYKNKIISNLNDD